MKTTNAWTRLITIALLLSIAATANADDIRQDPGYVDLEWIRIPDNAREVQDIDLGAMLLSIAADAEENHDEAFLKALSMIKSVRVKSWSIDGEQDDARQAVEKIAARLEKNDWKRLIYMKDDEEMVTVSTRYDGSDMVGLMLVSYEPDDSVTFVNVVGDLDLGTMLSLVQEFDDDSIEGMLAEFEGAHGHHEEHDD